jgi:glutathione S-transferase
LALPYEIKKYERTAEQLAPPELLAISPLGKSPVITDGDVTLAESGAIVGMDSILNGTDNALRLFFFFQST